jgi:hypothetical protein
MSTDTQIQEKRKATMHAKGLREFEAAIQRLLERKPRNELLKKMLSERGRIDIRQTTVALESGKDRSNMSKNYREIVRRIYEINSGFRGKRGPSLSERYREANLKIRELNNRIGKFETYVASLEVAHSNICEQLLHEQRHNQRADAGKVEEFPKR